MSHVHLEELGVFHAIYLNTKRFDAHISLRREDPWNMFITSKRTQAPLVAPNGSAAGPRFFAEGLPAKV